MKVEAIDWIVKFVFKIYLIRDSKDEGIVWNRDDNSTNSNVEATKSQE